MEDQLESFYPEPFFMVRGVTQAVECQPRKHKALSSSPSIAIKKKSPKLIPSSTAGLCFKPLKNL
jgi:hypothetical protein